MWEVLTLFRAHYWKLGFLRAFGHMKGTCIEIVKVEHKL